jgi:hypothetical protein
MGDVVYRGDAARQIEGAKYLYDTGDYTWDEANSISRKSIDIERSKRKLKVQEQFLALGSEEARLKQQEVQNNKFANQQKVGAAIASINPSDLRNFQSNVQKLREQYSDAFATDPDLQSALAESIKRNENYGKMASEMAVSAGTSLNDSLLNDDGTFNMSRAYSAGRSQKERDLRFSEGVKSSYKQKEDLRKRAFEEIASKRESGGRMARQRAQEQVAATGGKATYKEGGATVTLEPSSAMSAKGFRQMAEKENQEAVKAGKTPPNKIQEPVEFNPNDRKAAMLYAQEKAQQYGLTNNPDDRQTLIELVRAEGYNF